MNIHYRWNERSSSRYLRSFLFFSKLNLEEFDRHMIFPFDYLNFLSMFQNLKDRDRKYSLIFASRSEVP